MYVNSQEEVGRDEVVPSIISGNEVGWVGLVPGECFTRSRLLCFGHSIKTRSWFPFVMMTPKIIGEEKMGGEEKLGYQVRFEVWRRKTNRFR